MLWGLARMKFLTPGAALCSLKKLDRQKHVASSASSCLNLAWAEELPPGF